MAAELSVRKDGFVEMAYVGDIPWHGLGQQLDTGTSIEHWQKQAGMDWRICRSRVRYGEAPNQRIMDDKHVLFRSDTKDALGLVSADYKIVQPGEVLEFFRDLVAGNDFTLETAGVLFGGKQFWALASIGETALINGWDTVKGKLLLTSSCDGTRQTTAQFTTTRVVCNNTLKMALSNSEGAIKVSHKLVLDAGAMKAQLGIANVKFAQFMQSARQLADVGMSKNYAAVITERLLRSVAIDAKKTQEAIQDSAKFKGILDLFEHGKGNSGRTYWDWVNGVTEHVDYHTRGVSQSHKLASAWYGAGDALKTDAFEMALAEVG